jgi:hypothetical protein
LISLGRGHGDCGLMLARKGKPVAPMVVYTTLAGLVEIGRLAGEGRGRQAGDHANF